MRDFHIPLFPNGLYHVLNRGNGDERLFRTEENYRFFLQKYRQHISPIATTLAWCLLPNHYHFLVRINRAEVLQKGHFERKRKEIASEQLPGFIMQQFSNWQNSYAKALNKVYRRKGSLFMDYMRRVQVDKDLQLGNTVFYIHKNPVHHGFAKQIGSWPYSSYKEYLCGRFSVIDSKEVMEWFGAVENFIAFHRQPIAVK